MNFDNIVNIWFRFKYDQREKIVSRQMKFKFGMQTYMRSATFRLFVVHLRSGETKMLFKYPQNHQNKFTEGQVRFNEVKSVEIVEQYFITVNHLHIDFSNEHSKAKQSCSDHALLCRFVSLRMTGCSMGKIRGFRSFQIDQIWNDKSEVGI